MLKKIKNKNNFKKCDIFVMLKYLQLQPKKIIWKLKKDMTNWTNVNMFFFYQLAL